MNILLDSNAFVWLTDQKRARNIGKQSRRLIESCDSVYVSSITFAELRIKMMLRKITLEDNLEQLTEEAGLHTLDFTAANAESLVNFPSLVRHDPFDRMLLAQAQSENLRLLTSDTILLGLELDFVSDIHS